MTAIEFKNVSFCYDGTEKRILDNANFSVNYGEVALLSGYSGEGKSTVLSLIAGIIPNIVTGKLSGEIVVDGESILGKSLGEVCRKVGVVLQNADAQIIQQYVDDEIAFGCENFAFSEKEIEQSIDFACGQMKLRPDRKTRTLSGGQKQRLITASTLATRQKILVLDEPLANLDASGAKLLLAALQNLAKSGYAVLIIEHRLDMVLPYVNTVWQIENGKLKVITDKTRYLQVQSESIRDTCDSTHISETVFALKNVAFSVKNIDILTDITFNIKRGERLLLLGENGCGKTTLMRLLARLCKPTSGTITQSIDKRFGQKAKTNKAWFNKVGVVYQNPNYQLFMPTVKEEILFGAQSEEYAEEIMSMFRLTHLANRHPQSLSEGQKRRVSIAAVVASKPEVLLLDEPTVGQDYKGLREMVNILNALRQKSSNTMITVTHDKRCAEALCDRAVVIENGKIAKIGDKDLVHRFFIDVGR